MKKKILYISIIMMVLIFINSAFLINNVNAASVAGINCPSSVNVNSDFTVSLILPSNAYAAEANVSVKFGDGSTSSNKIVYVKGMENFSNSVTFKAKAAGAATVNVTNIVISDENAAEIEKGGSKSQGLTVVNPAPPTQNPDPTPTPDPKPDPKPEEKPDNKPTVKFTDVNETVYTTERCNIRESYSSDSKKIATVNKDTKLKRTGIGENGWSRIEYDGKTCYITSQYLNKDKPADPKIEEVNETMYAKQSCNLRASWTTDSDKVGYLNAGQEVTRIGVTDNGWSKLKYDNKEVYVASRLLQEEPLEEEKEEEPKEEPKEDEKTNTTTNPNITDDIATIKEKVGVLPEVGNNVAVYVYSVVAVIVSAVAGYGIYYTNKK